MIKVQEEVRTNGIELRGKAYDVLAYLESEAKRCQKMPMLQYIRLRKIEKEESQQFGVKDIRRGYNNVL